MTPLPRPVLHFTPPQGWMNDPNGLVYLDGEYHLFYQYHPESLVWGPMHWGHAVSRDLLRWEHLPIALFPDEHGTIFSGSAVYDHANSSGLVPGGGLVAMFSYHTQTQGVAYSRDRGRTWTKYEGNPVLPAKGENFRDPKVFAFGGRWTMVLAAGDHLEFYRSNNLTSWEQTGRFDAELEVGVWECPDLFPLVHQGRERWVLFLSVADKAPNGGSGTLYWVGDYDGRNFVTQTGPLWLDQGTDNYAGVTFNNAPQGQRLLVGWMNNWKYGRETPADAWRGAMTLPRVLTLETAGSQAAEPRLVQRPMAALEALRTNGQPIVAGPVAGLQKLGRLAQPFSLEVKLTSAEGACAVLRWWAKHTAFELRWDPAGNLTLHRGLQESAAFHPHFVLPVMMRVPPASELTLRVVGDFTSLEIFANGGAHVLTALIYPATYELELELLAEGSGVSLLGGQISTLRAR